MCGESRIEQGFFLRHFHSDIIHSYLSKPEQRISFSNLQNKFQYLPFTSNFSHQGTADHCKPKLSPIFVTASKASKGSALKNNQLSQKFSKSIEDIQNLKPVVEKAKTKKRGKVKSGKKRPSKTGVKRKKVNSKQWNNSISKFENTVFTIKASTKATKLFTYPHPIRKKTNNGPSYHRLKKQNQELPFSVFPASYDVANKTGSVVRDSSLPPCAPKTNSPLTTLTKQKGLLLPHPSISSVSPITNGNAVTMGDAPHKISPSSLSRITGEIGFALKQRCVKLEPSR